MAATTNDKLLQKQLAALTKRVVTLERFKRMIEIGADLQAGRLVKVDQPDGSAVLVSGPNLGKTASGL
jgi:hypothetical protein